MTKKSTKLLAELVQGMTGLTELDLNREQDMGEGLLDLAKELRHLTQLESLRLRKAFCLDSSLYEEAALALASSLARMSRLKALILEDEHLPEKGVLAIAEQLHQLPELTELTLNGKFNDASVAGVGSALSTLTRLQKLDLINSGAFISAAPIAENLHILTGLEDLIIHSFTLEVAFAGQLKHLTRLVSLSLQYCSLGNKAALSLAGVCSRLSRLQWIDISGNHMDDATRIELQKRTMFGRELSHLESLEVGDINFQPYCLHKFVKSYPLHFAAACGDVTLVREVLASKVDANQIEIRTGESAIFYAARQGHDEVIRVLVEEGGASLSVKNTKGRSVIDTAPPRSSTRALLEEMILTGADERPGEMIKGAAKRFKPFLQ